MQSGVFKRGVGQMHLVRHAGLRIEVFVGLLLEHLEKINTQD
jgi:hypothetical protein